MVDPLNSLAGRNIRRHRKKLGLTQEQLAERADLHRTFIGVVERGEKTLSLDSLARIARALGTTPQELLSSDAV